MLAVNEGKNTIPWLLNKKWTTEEKYIPPRRKMDREMYKKYIATEEKYIPPRRKNVQEIQKKITRHF